MLNQTCIRVLQLLDNCRSEELSGTDIKRILDLRFPPYNEISELLNKTAISQFIHPNSAIVLYSITPGGKHLLELETSQQQPILLAA